ncbi:MAG: hydrogenase [Chloroflexi bacterium]|nr:hydrogenase [Chloroflexota bacterium]
MLTSDGFIRILNLLSVGVLVTGMLILWRRSLLSAVQIFGVQSLLLALMAVWIAFYTGAAHLYLIAFLVAAIKAVAIPVLLSRIIRRLDVYTEIEPYIGVATSLLVGAGLVVVAYFVMQPVADATNLPTHNALPLAFAMVLLGLFITVSRKKAVTQILGFLVLENGIFMLAVLATYGVPTIVEIGVFLDLFVGILIMEVLVYRINQTFESVDTHVLDELRG